MSEPMSELAMIGMLIECMKAMSDRIKDLEVRLAVMETKYEQTRCFITNTLYPMVAKQEDDGK